MNIEKAVENCEIYLKRMEQYDPDPFYVNYFFNEYINCVNNVLNGIFEKANRDFGLFILKDISHKEFYEKAKKKDDQNAIRFSEWYSTKYNQEHENSYPNFIKKICQFKKEFQKLPKMKVMIRALDRYKDDVNQQIRVNFSHEKLRSKEEIQIEIKRQLPIFLEIINLKRNKKNEPKVGKNQVSASVFVDIEEHCNIEIVYASKIYIPVLKRMVEESRKKIKELTVWK